MTIYLSTILRSDWVLIHFALSLCVSLSLPLSLHWGLNTKAICHWAIPPPFLLWDTISLSCPCWPGTFFLDQPPGKTVFFLWVLCQISRNANAPIGYNSQEKICVPKWGIRYGKCLREERKGRERGWKGIRTCYVLVSILHDT